MAALLQLVSPMPASVLAGTQWEPRVFSASFLERLAQLTHAERELRRLGLHVIWSRLAGPKPQAHIQRDETKSITEGVVNDMLPHAPTRRRTTQSDDQGTLF